MDGLAPLAPGSQARVLLSSRGRGWKGLAAEFVHVAPGLTRVPASATHRLGVHVGRAVNADCRCDGRRHRRVQAHGDIDVVAAGLDGSWQDDADCTILRLHLTPALIDRAAAELGGPGDGNGIEPRFQLRDPGLQAVAWAIKAELEAPVPGDPLYAETLGLALAVRLLTIGRQPGPQPGGGDRRQGLSPRQRRDLETYIEAHLDEPLALAELAAVAGLGPSHFKTLFRNSFGVPVHRHVLQRRVERARALILAGRLPMSQVALAAGFAHQSHMAHWMRRLLGTVPGEIARSRD